MPGKHWTYYIGNMLQKALPNHSLFSDSFRTMECWIEQMIADIIKYDQKKGFLLLKLNLYF